MEKQQDRPELVLKKWQESFSMLQERFSKFTNMKTETLDISLLKPSADSLVVDGFQFDQKQIKLLLTFLKTVWMFFETFLLVSQME